MPGKVIGAVGPGAALWGSLCDLTSRAHGPAASGDSATDVRPPEEQRAGSGAEAGQRSSDC